MRGDYVFLDYSKMYLDPKLTFDVISDFESRSNFSKLRLGSHELQIETGRYGKIQFPKKKDNVCFVSRDLTISLKISFIS